MSVPKIVEGLDPCEDCGAPWMDEGNGTPTQTHTDKCWTAPRTIGTPLSQLSGRPGHPGYPAFKRIAASWGYD